jgi:scyllo-inositol 2-dehydrogenase (NADP+)
MAKTNVLVLAGGASGSSESAALVQAFLEASGRYTVHTSNQPAALRAESLARYKAVVCCADDMELRKSHSDALLAYVRKGGGLVALGNAAGAFSKAEAYGELVGARLRERSPLLDFTFTPSAAESMITKRISPCPVVDYLYFLDRFDPKSSEVLAQAHWQGATVPVAYTRGYGQGRVFVLMLGGAPESFRLPEVRKLALRGLDWTLGREERKPLKAGVVGYGPSFHMGRLHMQWLREMAGFDTVAAADIDPLRCIAAEEENPGITTYPSLGDMLKKSDVELVVVITPHESHARLAQQVLNSGRHCITEKPFCITTKEADAMIDAARKNKRMLSVFHNRRWDGDYRTIHRIIEQGLIGEVFHIECCFGGYGHPSYWWRSHKPIAGGAFYDWGAHFIDWILNLVPSRIAEVSGYFQFKRRWIDVTNEDHCEALIRFENGTRASLEISSLAAIPKARWRILGTAGAIEDLGNEKFRVVSHRDGLRTDSEVKYLESDWPAYYRNIADHLLLGEPLAVTPESARRVIGVIETAEKSSRAGKALSVPKGCE